MKKVILALFVLLLGLGKSSTRATDFTDPVDPSRVTALRFFGQDSVVRIDTNSVRMNEERIAHYKARLISETERFTNLKFLTIRKVPSFEDVVEKISKLQSLTDLFIEDISVPTNFMTILSTMTALKNLWIIYSTLESPHIRPGGALPQAFLGLTELEMLHITNTYLSKGLENLPFRGRAILNIENNFFHLDDIKKIGGATSLFKSGIFLSQGNQHEPSAHQKRFHRTKTSRATPRRR